MLDAKMHIKKAASEILDGKEVDLGGFSPEEAVAVMDIVINRWRRAVAVAKKQMVAIKEVYLSSKKTLAEGETALEEASKIKDALAKGLMKKKERSGDR